MGHVIHHAIVVTSFDKEKALAANAYATSLGCSVTPLIESNINGDWSFLIGPDGSKTGWQHSHDGDARRDGFIAWAKGQRYEDGSSPICWVEIAYGSDDRTARVERHEWKRSRKASLGSPLKDLEESVNG